MCGRFTLTASGEELAEAFDLDSAPSLTPRYNIAPTQPVLVVRPTGGGLRRETALWAGPRPGAPSSAHQRPGGDGDRLLTFRDSFGPALLGPASGF
jgi:putative SOS response-associated peptidase YedK